MVDTNIKHRSEENKIRILNYDITLYDKYDHLFDVLV